MSATEAQILTHLLSIDVGIWTVVLVNSLGFGTFLVRDALRARDAERLVRLRGPEWAIANGVLRDADLLRSKQGASPTKKVQAKERA